jgi:acyl dehydratase
MGLLANDSIGTRRTSDWTHFSQAEINSFGQNTRDVAALHMDAAWAKQNSPFQRTIAYGFQTLSLLTWLNHQVFDKLSDADNGYPINYGFERIRFTGPVPVDHSFRGHITLTKLEERKPGQQLQTFAVEIEVEGNDRPVLVAEWLALWVTEDGHKPLRDKQSG